MKKLFLILLVLMFAMSFLAAAKTEVINEKDNLVLTISPKNQDVADDKDLSEANQGGSHGKNDLNDSNDVFGNGSEMKGVENKDDEDLGNTTRARIEERVRLNNFNLSEEFDNTTNRTRLKAKLSNGRDAEIKVMPETASQRALEVLRTKGQNNYSIELKEVGKDNSTKLAYEYKEQVPVKVFGLFKTRMKVQAQIDAETGEVIQAKKPWWSFLAGEDDSNTQTA